MIPEICVDANLAVKWYIPEIWREQAVELFDCCMHSGISIIAPDAIFAEAGSAIRRAVHRGLITPDSGRMAVFLLRSAPIDHFDVRDLFALAWQIAESHGLATLYDAYYLALAEIRGCDFWTADERFVNSVHGLSRVRHIKDFIPDLLDS